MCMTYFLRPYSTELVHQFDWLYTCEFMNSYQNARTGLEDFPRENSQGPGQLTSATRAPYPSLHRELSASEGLLG